MIFKIIQKIKFWWIITGISPVKQSVNNISDLDLFTIEQIDQIRECQFESFFNSLKIEIPTLFKEKSDCSKLLSILNYMTGSCKILDRIEHDKDWKVYKNPNNKIIVKIHQSSNVWFKIFYENMEVFSYYPYNQYYIPGKHWHEIINLIKLYSDFLENNEFEERKTRRNELINQIIKQDNPFEE